MKKLIRAPLLVEKASQKEKAFTPRVFPRAHKSSFLLKALVPEQLNILEVREKDVKRLKEKLIPVM